MTEKEIPADVMEAARRIMAASPVEFGGGLEGGAVLRCIIDAIMAERERCAAIVDEQIKTTVEIAVKLAVKAERERCAKIAEDFSRYNAGNMTLVDAGFSISRTIRGEP